MSNYYRNMARREAKARRNWEELQDTLAALSCGEWDGLVLNDSRNGRRDEIPRRYRGRLLHVSDHGNVSLYRVFANGNWREISSCV
jgi:hypothetical protein